MNMTVNQQDEVTVFAVSGELTHESVARFREGIDKAFNDGHRDFIVDLRQVEGVDSAGLEAFTGLQRQCEEQLGMVRMCGATATLRKVFELTRLDRALVLNDDLEEALASFR